MYSPIELKPADLPVYDCDSFPDYVDPFTPPASEEDSCSENNDMAPHMPMTLEPLIEGEVSRGPSPQPTHFATPSATEYDHANGHRTLRSSTVGYVAPEFHGKLQQKMEVSRLITDSGWIPEGAVDEQITWFYDKLGIDDVYFTIEKPSVIANQITSLYAAKIAAFSREDKREEIRLDMESADHAIYIDTSEPGKVAPGGPQYEHRLENKYLDHVGSAKFRVETFRSPGGLGASPTSKASLRCYFVYQCDFNSDPANVDPKETNLELISDKGFWQKATQNTKQIYQDIINLAVNRTGPVIEVFDVPSYPEKRLVIAFRTRTAHGIFSALSDLYHYYGVTSARKYVEQFANGITVMSVYLRQAMNLEGRFPPIDQSIHQITKEISLLYCIPQTKFHDLFSQGEFSLQEAVYAHSAWVFIQHFLNRLGAEYKSLSEILDSSNNAHSTLLSKLKRRLRTETFTPDYITEIIRTYPGLVKQLYASFAKAHLSPNNGEKQLSPTTPSADILSDQELKDLIGKTVSNDHDSLVMDAFRTFNNAILKTNYFTPTKVGISFRLDPSFLPEHEYPKRLYGMFLVISAESRGFHLRFKDIARGGIRIVKSRSKEAYSINTRNLFDENYGLASTQQRKNKDIPEGGSKGVILLDPKAQDKAREAFEKYIDAILDLLLPARTPGIKNPIVDLYGKEEILFMGPDENTADLVDWATEHAKSRGAPWWKSFFTGKSPRLGGIPHDSYGMTTLSVREYVKGIYRKLQLDPSAVKKMQTGGPDGDLGSNEILLSNEKYTAVVDGAGVLVDPNGLDKEELTRLARKRVMISEFDLSKLSKDGYRVLCEDNNVTLPTGELVTNGTIFRNTYHLRDSGLTDCFVPCGGRPESIDLISVGKLIKEGKSTVPYIVEGANLFITQDAKLRLESAGCVLFKDASANKGGVTSSSLEVLAALSFDDAGFSENMCIGADGEAPQFYKDYVRGVQAKIQDNARLEFEAIWREHEQTGVPRSILSDKLSLAITDLDEQLQHSDLWADEKIRRATLSDALPPLLLAKIGLDTIIERVPDSYLRAIFGSYLASRFVYEFGSSPSQFAFFDFMSKRTAQLK